MALQVGSAFSSYDLDISGLRKSIAEAKRLLDDLRKDSSKPLPTPKVPTGGSGGDPLASVTAGQARAAVTAGKLATEQKKAATEAQRLATEQKRAAVEAQKLATEEQKTAREASNTAAAQDRAAKSALSLAAAQAKAAKAAQNGGDGPALPRTFAGFTPQGLNQAAGAFGLATIGPQVIGQTISLGIESGKAALALRETKNSLRAVSGDLTTYNTTLQAARDQQRLFGGTLQENIEGLSGLTITARSSGASLQSLIGLSQRLAVLDPAQGASGARIALNEALSGDPTSLAKRYEIPRAALAKLRDTALPVEERLKVIDSFLNKVGITAESVAGRVDQDALAFRGLNAELEQAKLNAGDNLATAFAGAATGLTRLVGVINGNPEAFAKIKALLEGRSGVSQADIDKQAQNLRAADVIDAQSGAGDAAFARDKLNGVTTNTTALEAAKNRLLVFGASSDDAKAKVIALYAAFAQTGDINAFILGAHQIQTTSERGSKAIQTLAERTAEWQAILRGSINEIRASAQASELDNAKKNALAATTNLLNEQSKLAVDTFLALNPTIDASAAASKAAADGYSPQIQQLIALGVEARNAKNALGELNGAGAVTEGRSERDTPAELAQGRTAGLQLVRDQADALEKARIDRILRTGTALQVVAVRQQQYNDAVKQFGAKSAQAVNAQTTLIEAQQAADKPKKTGGPKGISALDRSELALITDKQARLDEINQILARGNLTQLQRNQYLKEQHDLQDQINDAVAKQRDLVTDIALAQVKDAQADLKAKRESAGLERALQSGRISGDQRAAAQLRLRELALEDAKRGNDIADKQGDQSKLQRDFGKALNGLPVVQSDANVPVPAGATNLNRPTSVITPSLASTQTVVNLTLNIDKSGNVRVGAVDPNLVLNLIGTTSNFRNLSGGTP
jgi:hypothetical protein